MTAAAPLHPTRWWLPLVLLATTSLAQTAPSTAPSTAPAIPEPYRPLLLAHGSADHYWIARVESYQDGPKVRMRTLVRAQDLPAGDWQDLGAIFGHAVALAESQGELAVLLEDGSWKRRSAAGLATGPLIPGTGPVLAWASSARDLYAVRNVEGGAQGVATRPVEAAPRPAAATQPATAATAATTQRAFVAPSIATRPSANVAQLATRPAPTRPARPTLLQFQRGQWVAVGELPALSAAAQLALAVTGNNPLLAASTDGGANVRTFLWQDGHWRDFGAIRTGQRPGRFGLLGDGLLPAVWTIDPDGAMKLFLKREGEDWTAAAPFALPPNLPETAQRTLATAGQDFRLVLLKDGNVFERRYDTTGSPRSELAQLPTPQAYRPDAMFWAVRAFVILGMVIVMLLTFYHRRGPPEQAANDDR
jgi:hypothetical protein